MQVQIASGLPRFTIVGLPDKAVAGVLPAAIGAASADLSLVCPAGNGPEAAWASHGEIVPASDLLALINHFKDSQVLGPPPPAAGPLPLYPDLADIKGQ